MEREFWEKFKKKLFKEYNSYKDLYLAIIGNRRGEPKEEHIDTKFQLEDTDGNTYDVGKIKSGDIVVLAAFGSGFTWGSTIIKW